MSEIGYEPEKPWLSVRIVRNGEPEESKYYVAGGGATYKESNLRGVTEISFRRLDSPWNACDVSLRNANRRLSEEIKELSASKELPPTIGSALRMLWRAL